MASVTSTLQALELLTITNRCQSNANSKATTLFDTIAAGANVRANVGKYDFSDTAESVHCYIMNIENPIISRIKLILEQNSFSSRRTTLAN